MLMSATACAQIINIENQPGQIVDGTYYKDTNNLLNPFVGTFTYSNGSDEVQLTFLKKVMSSMNNVYYEDLLIGEYRYIKNGVEVANTLTNLNNSYANGVKYSLWGNTILVGNVRGCSDCASNEKRLEVSLVDNAQNRTGSVILRKITQSGQEAISATIMWDMRVYDPVHEPPTDELVLPTGTFILLKQ